MATGNPIRSSSMRGGVVPHSVHDAVDANGWTVRAASRQGDTRQKTRRQDAYAVRHGGGRIAVVVCDGVGAAEHSHLAAAAASAALAEHLLTAELEVSGDWTAHLKVASLAVTRAAGDLLGNRAPSLGAVYSVMATTATALVVEPTDIGQGPWLAHTATVGDSSAWWRRTRGGALGFEPWLLMSGGRLTRHQIATSGALVLPLPDDAVVTGASFEIGPEELLLVCSDGVADAFDDGSSAVAASFASGWSNPPRISDLADRIAFDADRQVDDRTVVGVWTPR
ncbi:protein phosphatase 2C domain-containing protein [Rhodococcus sp. Q]|uniref:protein phosphatase 2C domain-containing protein n=1 Tax=Rhodococcus sp. Q TaxID=2502252 RepID=UPI0010F9D77E|nr:protein phosphatase 2C domain-containing protein [Rhodococcus sp. Q]